MVTRAGLDHVETLEWSDGLSNEDGREVQAALLLEAVGVHTGDAAARKESTTDAFEGLCTENISN